MRNRSVSSARKWIDAFRLSTNCELIAGCASTSCTAALRVERIALEHGDERRVRSWIDVQLRDEAGEERAQVRERPIALAERTSRT